MFLSPFQAAPLDLDSLDFFPSRLPAIQQRLDLLAGWSNQDLVEWIRHVWNDNYGRISLVSWDRFRDFEHASGLLRCIPVQVFSSISERLLRNYRHCRSGFPDLIVWNPTEEVIDSIFNFLFLF